MFCSVMNASNGWVAVALYLLDSLMQSLGTRVMPVGGGGGREKERERSGYETAIKGGSKADTYGYIDILMYIYTASREGEKQRERILTHVYGGTGQHWLHRNNRISCKTRNYKNMFFSFMDGLNDQKADMCTRQRAQRVHGVGGAHTPLYEVIHTSCWKGSPLQFSQLRITNWC